MTILSSTVCGGFTSIRVLSFVSSHLYPSYNTERPQIQVRISSHSVDFFIPLYSFYRFYTPISFQIAQRNQYIVYEHAYTTIYCIVQFYKQKCTFFSAIRNRLKSCLLPFLQTSLSGIPYRVPWRSHTPSRFRRSDHDPSHQRPD